MEILVMRIYPSFRVSALHSAVCLTLLLAASNAHAEGQIDIKPYVSGTFLYDDNLFRFGNKAEARAFLGTEAMSDTMRVGKAGVNVDWRISQQHLRAELNIDQNKFDRFSFLDNLSHNFKFAWDWKLGNHLDGQISTSENSAMAGFTEISNPVLNERTTTKNLYSLNWAFHPSWKLHLQRDESSQENALAIYRVNDRQETAHEGAIQYIAASGNSVSLTARQVDAEYPTRDAFSTFFFGNNNSQLDLSVNVNWQYSGKTSFSGRLARIERSYKELPQRNVKALAGNINATWQPTGHTLLGLSITRDIYGVDDIAASYVQTDSISVAPTWRPTAKLAVQARAAYENREYLGISIVTAAPRSDKVRSAGLTVSYTPYEKVQAQLSWQMENRSSTNAANGYDDNTLSANIRVDF